MAPQRAGRPGPEVSGVRRVSSFTPVLSSSSTCFSTVALVNRRVMLPGGRWQEVGEVGGNCKGRVLICLSVYWSVLVFLCSQQTSKMQETGYKILKYNLFNSYSDKWVKSKL